MNTDLSCETMTKRANAVDTDVERDTYFLEKLKKHRELAAKEGPRQSSSQKKSVLDRPSFSIQRGLDVELARLHPSRKCRCSDSLQAKCDAAGIVMEHLGVTIGTVLRGLDLTLPQPQHVIDAIRQALLERKVVFFREQDLTREQHKAFGRRFGTLEVHPFAPSLEGHPEILQIVHNDKLPGTQNMWHSDVTWRAEPSLGSILYCKEAPEYGGGDTLFSDSHAQYEGLAPQLRERACGLNAKHDFVGFRRAQLKQGVPKDIIEEMAACYPMPSHPVIRTHPETGKQSVYINEAFTQYVESVDKAEGDALARKLYAMATVPEYQCRFTWGKGSIAFWDNRACQHYAVADYYPQFRVMERVTICGDRPFYNPHESVVNPDMQAKL